MTVIGMPGRGTFRKIIILFQFQFHFITIVTRGLLGVIVFYCALLCHK